jgi:hypothetical protein
LARILLPARETAPQRHREAQRGIAATKLCHSVRLERFGRGTLTTEDTERHRGSQRKAERKEEGAEIFASREEGRVSSTEVTEKKWMS